MQDSNQGVLADTEGRHFKRARKTTRQVMTRPDQTLIGLAFLHICLPKLNQIDFLALIFHHLSTKLGHEVASVTAPKVCSSECQRFLMVFDHIHASGVVLSSIFVEFRRLVVSQPPRPCPRWSSLPKFLQRTRPNTFLQSPKLSKREGIEALMLRM